MDRGQERTAFIILLIILVFTSILLYNESQNRKEELAELKAAQDLIVIEYEAKEQELAQKVADFEQTVKEVEEFKKTDEYFFQKAITEKQSENYSESNRLLQEMMTRFPSSSKVNEASKIIDENLHCLVANEIEKAENLSEKNEFDAALAILDSAAVTYPKSTHFQLVNEAKGKINKKSADHKKDEPKRLLESAKQCTDAQNANYLLDQLLAKYPNSSQAKEAANLKKKNDQKIEEEEESRYDSIYKLELVSWNWEKRSGYAIAKGLVKNKTSSSLEDVEAVVTIKDKNGEYISHGSSLITYNPILPGQTSPFEVYINWNPEMVKAAVEFKTLFGEALPTKRKKK